MEKYTELVFVEHRAHSAYDLNREHGEAFVEDFSLRRGREREDTEVCIHMTCGCRRLIRAQVGRAHHAHWKGLYARVRHFAPRWLHNVRRGRKSHRRIVPREKVKARLHDATRVYLFRVSAVKGQADRNDEKPDGNSNRCFHNQFVNYNFHTKS